MNNNLYEVSKGPENLKFHKTLYVIFEILKYLNIIVVALALILAVSISNTFFIVVALFAGSWLLAWWVGSKFYNFYDYCYVDGSVRIIKVIHNRTRRLVINFDAKNINSYGLVDGETYAKYIKDKSVKKLYASPDGLTIEDIAVYLTSNGIDYLLLIKYDETFMATLMRNTGVRKLDKSFIEKVKNS